MSPEERAELIEAMKEVFPTREDYAELRSGLREEMDERFGAMREEMDGRFGELRGEMNARFDLVPTREEMNARFELVATREEMNGRFEETREELREGLEENKRHFGALAEHLRSDIQGVAEGVENVSQRVDRLLEERTRSRAEELDVLRAGYRHLDGRVGHLDGRVERLEREVFREPKPPAGR